MGNDRKFQNLLTFNVVMLTIDTPLFTIDTKTSFSQSYTSRNIFNIDVAFVINAKFMLIL